MKKTTYLALALGTCISFSSTLQAQQLEAALTEVAKKVDTDGAYLELNRIDGDIKVVEEYAELGLQLLKNNEADIPKGLNVKKLIKLFGVDVMKATAKSSKKVDGSWNNRAYLWTGGSDKGIFSFYGGQDEKLEVTHFAPETADVALQLRLNLVELGAIIKEVAGQTGMSDQANGVFTQPIDPLGGMTGYQVIEKLDLRASIAIDIEREKRMRLPGASLPEMEIVARLDGAAWVWPLVGDLFIQQSGQPWQLNEEDGVKTYTLPAEAADRMLGYSPIIQITKDSIWLASKPSILKAAQSDGKKLKDGAAFKKTMATLPQSGNSLAYISEDFIAELVAQYKSADKAGHLDDPDFQAAKPLVDKLIADLTKPGSGIAAVIDVDQNGMNSVLRVPFPTKNYLTQLTPMFQSAVAAPLIMRQIKKNEVQEHRFR